jgi:hypothetical protein
VIDFGRSAFRILPVIQNSVFKHPELIFPQTTRGSTVSLLWQTPATLQVRCRHYCCCLWYAACGLSWLGRWHDCSLLKPCLQLSTNVRDCASACRCHGGCGDWPWLGYWHCRSLLIVMFSTPANHREIVAAYRCRGRCGDRTRLGHRHCSRRRLSVFYHEATVAYKNDSYCLQVWWWVQ